MGIGYRVPDRYDRHIGPARESGSKWIIDLDQSGLLGKPESAVKPGRALHRLLFALVEDFYVAKTVPALFSKVYPDQAYHPRSSPQAVHQCIQRLRREFKKLRIPLEIAERGGRFGLTSEKGVTIRISREMRESDSPGSLQDHWIARIRAHWGTEASFNVPELASLLDISSRSANRLILGAQEAGIIETFGRARATRYRLKA
jgi:hypothetical protein